VIQAFLDFQCPFCQRVQPTLEQLLKQYPKEVRIVYRHLPLGFHENARLAAEASMEAFAQKGEAGFLAYHDRLFENQTALSRADLERYAQEVGLDLTRFRAALDQNAHAGQIEADEKLAANIGISGTPSFLINDYLLVGAQAESHFRRRIKLALATKKGRTGK
jgi:protein-disulfide isomerase